MLAALVEAPCAAIGIPGDWIRRYVRCQLRLPRRPAKLAYDSQHYSRPVSVREKCTFASKLVVTVLLFVGETKHDISLAMFASLTILTIVDTLEPVGFSL